MSAVAGNVLVPTGTANLASVLAAFRRLGVGLTVTSDPGEVGTARRVVLPGVGTFGAAMGQLEETGVAPVIRHRIEEGRATLAICVGMQLLGEKSEESPQASGLGVVPVPITRFDEDLIVPQLAWSRVTPGSGSRYIEAGWAYFANSYRVEDSPDGWVTASAEYGSRFVAAMERNGVLACQFHPELSGAWGMELLGRWLDTTARTR